MFDQVSTRYDRTNAVLSVGNAQLWRAATVRAVDPRAGERILDLAAGTGTSQRRAGPQRRPRRRRRLLAGHDRGRARQHAATARSSSCRPTPRRCRSPTTSSTPSRSRSACATSSTRMVALAEMYRVAKPGGRIVICEFSKPPRAPFRAGYFAYLDNVMPTVVAARVSNARGLRLPGRLDQGVARPEHAQPHGCARRGSGGRVPQPHRRDRRPAPRAQAPTRRPARPRNDPLRDARAARSAGAAAAAQLDARTEREALRLQRGPRGGPRIDDGLERVEAGLLAQVTFHDEIADVRARYLLDAGGKRVRPVLTLLTAQLGDGITDDVVTAGAGRRDHPPRFALPRRRHGRGAERRGVPSAQKVWGNSVAILTGDLLFARASKLIASLGERASSCRRTPSSGCASASCTRRSGRRDGEDPIEHYLQVLADKTGSLISAAAECRRLFCERARRVPRARCRVRREDRRRLPAHRRRDRPSRRVEAAPARRPAPTCARAWHAAVALPAQARRADAEAADAARAHRDVDGRRRRPSRPTPTSTPAVAELREHHGDQRHARRGAPLGPRAVEALAPLPDGPVKKALTRFAETVVDRSN